MLTSIHNHFNLRKLADVDLDAAVIAKLAKPPSLKNRRKAENHIVSVTTEHGEMKLFRVTSKDVSYVVTITPDVVVANAA